MANGRTALNRLGEEFGYEDYLKTDILPGLSQQYNVNPQLLGQDVGRYYTAALSEQPGYEAIMRNISGQLSPETKRAIGQAAAERGVSIGSYGGGADATAMLRALGLSSQALTNQGIQQYLEAQRSVPGLSPSNLFISPTQQAQLGLQQQLQSQRLAFEESEAEKNRRLQETLARWGAESSQFQTGMQIAAQQSAAAAERAAQEAFNQQFLSQQANQAQLLSGYNPSAVSSYGTLSEPLAGVQVYDPYTGTYY